MPTKSPMIFSLGTGLNNYLLNMVRRYSRSLELILHISPTHYKAHTFLRYILKHAYFLIFNHKFTYNTKMNKVENKKVKPKCIYENDMMKG